jgi:acyl-coenzyme A synthetase/AMP-(fatty) acid ligase
VSLVSVPHLLAGQRPADHVVATRRREALPLGRLRAEIAWASGALRARRVRRGLLVCTDSFQFVVGMMALLGAGAEVVLPPNSRPGTLASLAGTFDMLVSDEVLLAGTEALVLDGSGDSGAPPAIDPPSARIDFFTSGSTGQSKRIEKTLAMLEREAATLDSIWGASIGAAPAIGTVTHQHIYGLAFQVMWPLLSGRRFASQVHDTWESLMADLDPGATIISSPAHLSRLAGLPRLDESRKPALIFTAGGALAPQAASDTKDIFGVALTEIFGSTETGALACRTESDEAGLWRPLPGIEVSTTDSGLLHVSSPYVAGGNCELADKIILRADGRFHLEGRADRIVKIEGRRVSLPALEAAIKRLDWVADAAVATIPPAETALGAIVVLTSDGQAALAQHGKFRFERMLRRELATTHEPASLPRRWRFVREIPADSLGKRRQRDLALLLNAETSA